MNPPPPVDDRPFRRRLADRLFQPRYAGRSALTAVSAAMLVGIVSVLAIAFVLIWMNQQKFLPAEIAIALVVILGALVLVLCVACLSIVLKRLALADRRYAMGLPEGSIRAILALMLVLLFGVVSVFLIGSAERSGGGRHLENLTLTQADALPEDQVLSRVETPPDSGRYDVVMTAVPNAPLDDLSKQLLTTLATLVVAIAAFYFGASTVTNAVDTVTQKRQHGTGEDEPSEDAKQKAEAEAEAARQAEAARRAADAQRDAADRAKVDDQTSVGESAATRVRPEGETGEGDTAEAAVKEAEAQLATAFVETERAATLTRSTEYAKAVAAIAAAAEAVADLRRVRAENAGSTAAGAAAPTDPGTASGAVAEGAPNPDEPGPEETAPDVATGSDAPAITTEGEGPDESVDR